MSLYSYHQDCTKENNMIYIMCNNKIQGNNFVRIDMQLRPNEYVLITRNRYPRGIRVHTLFVLLFPEDTKLYRDWMQAVIPNIMAPKGNIFTREF